MKNIFSVLILTTIGVLFFTTSVSAQILPDLSKQIIPNNNVSSSSQAVVVPVRIIPKVNQSSSSSSSASNTLEVPIHLRTREIIDMIDNNPNRATLERTSSIEGIISAKDESLATIKVILKDGASTYIVDVSKTKYIVKDVDKPKISDLSVGDIVWVKGLINGTSVIATVIDDQKEKAEIPQDKSQQTKQGFWSRVVGGVSGFFKKIFGFFGFK